MHGTNIRAISVPLKTKANLETSIDVSSGTDLVSGKTGGLINLDKLFLMINIA